MRILHSTIGALLGLAMALGSGVYAQSGGGSGGGATGAASGGVAGATGSAGVASGVSGPGGNVGGVAGGGVGVGIGGNRGFGAATPVPGAFSPRMNGGFNNNPFGAGQNQAGFGNRQGFNQSRNQSGFNRGRGDFERSGRSFDQQQGFSGQGSFDGGRQAEFSQGVANQGAFGLGNGNRSGFFDNQPFNNQGFGQGVGGGSGANSSRGFTAAGDPPGFAGSDTRFEEFGEAGDPTFTGSEFQPRELDGEQGFSGSSELDAGEDAFRGEGFGDDRDDISSSDATRGFGTTSDFESDTGAGAGPNSSRGFTAANDPPGFNGTASPLSRSSSGDIGRAGETFGEEESFGNEPVPFGQQRLVPQGAASAANNRFGDQPGNARRTAQPATNLLDERAFEDDERGFGEGSTGFDQPNTSAEQPPGTFDGRGDTNDNGRFFNPSQEFPPRGGGFGPGGINFLEEYSATHQPVVPAGAGATQGAGGRMGAGSNSGRGSGSFQQRQPDSRRPNNFNGSFSRTRL